jgi:hypothetical protein
MQRVQTRSRRVVPSTTARTVCKFGYQRRFVLLLAWLTLWPVVGPFPQISHTRAMGVNPENERVAATPRAHPRRGKAPET